MLSGEVPRMKKILAVFAIITVFSIASAKDYFGVYLGYPGGLGGQYTVNDSLRFSLGVPFFYGGLGADASVDFLVPGGPLDKGLKWYYGGGVGIYTYGKDVSGTVYTVTALFPHFILGVDYLLSSDLSLFWEANFGLGVYAANVPGAPGYGPGYGAKLGFNFK